MMLLRRTLFLGVAAVTMRGRIVTATQPEVQLPSSRTDLFNLQCDILKELCLEEELHTVTNMLAQPEVLKYADDVEYHFPKLCAAKKELERKLEELRSPTPIWREQPLSGKFKAERESYLKKIVSTLPVLPWSSSTSKLTDVEELVNDRESLGPGTTLIKRTTGMNLAIIRIQWVSSGHCVGSKLRLDADGNIESEQLTIRKLKCLSGDKSLEDRTLYVGRYDKKFKAIRIQLVVSDIEVPALEHVSHDIRNSWDKVAVPLSDGVAATKDQHRIDTIQCHVSVRGDKFGLSPETWYKCKVTNVVRESVFKAHDPEEINNDMIDFESTDYFKGGRYLTLRPLGRYPDGKVDLVNCCFRTVDRFEDSLRPILLPVPVPVAVPGPQTSPNVNVSGAESKPAWTTRANFAPGQVRGISERIYCDTRQPETTRSPTTRDRRDCITEGPDEGRRRMMSEMEIQSDLLRSFARRRRLREE